MVINYLVNAIVWYGIWTNTTLERDIDVVFV